MIDNKQISSSFLKLEREISAFSIQIDDINIWELIRFPLYKSIYQKTKKSTQDSKLEYGIEDYINITISAMRNSIYDNPLFLDSTNRLYIGKGRRKKLSDGKWWDIYCDPIHEYETIDYLQLDFPFDHHHKEPAKTQNLQYLDIITYIGMAAKKLPSIGVEVSKSEQQKLDEIESKIENTYDVKVNLTSLVEGVLTRRKCTKPLYRILLKHLDPNIVVMVCSYYKEHLIEVCSDMCIPTVELQHGIIQNNHFGYNFPGERTKDTFPDHLFVWGDFWEEAVTYPIPNKNIFSVGFPYLEQSADMYSNISHNNQILFISQGNIGKILSKLAVKVHNHPNIGYDVVYKIHPKQYDQWKVKYPWLVNAGIDVVDSSEPPLYELFAKSNAQVGVQSTAIYEGLCFNLETYIYDLPGSTPLYELVEQGAAKLISSADDLAPMLGSDTISFDREHYFKSNAIKNTREALQRVAYRGS
jgi:hypothetical protein